MHQSSDGEFHGKVALVTGGSKGIGLAVARRLAAGERASSSVAWMRRKLGKVL